MRFNLNIIFLILKVTFDCFITFVGVEFWKSNFEAEYGLSFIFLFRKPNLKLVMF